MIKYIIIHRTQEGNRMSEGIISTGLEGLDRAIGSLHPGENVVW